RISYPRHECRLGNAVRLSKRHRAEAFVRRAGPEKPARQAHAPTALRPRRLHDEAFRARLLGGSFSRIGRSNCRQRRTRKRRQITYAHKLTRAPARAVSWAIQVERRLYAPGNPLLRSGLSDVDDCPEE